MKSILCKSNEIELSIQLYKIYMNLKQGGYAHLYKNTHNKLLHHKDFKDSIKKHTSFLQYATLSLFLKKFQLSISVLIR